MSRHLLAIGQYYDAQRPGLGETFIDDYAATVTAISEMPTAYPTYSGNVRRAKCGRFPHRVYFEVVSRNRIRLLAIYHPSRDLAKWRDRG